MTNSDNSNLAVDAKAGLVNYRIASLFQQVDVPLNGNLISSSTKTYANRAMLEVHLGYDHGAKNSYLTMGLYSKDTVMKLDLVAVSGVNKARTQCIKESKKVEKSSLLHCDFVNSDCLILNGLLSKTVLHRQRDSSILMADDASRDCRVRIKEAQLCVRYVKLSNEKYINIQQRNKRVVMNTHSVA